MSVVNIDEILFRCHSLGDIMGVKGLGKTGQKRAIQTYIEYKYGRTKRFTSNKTEKGLITESESVKVIADHFQLPLLKNERRESNEFITGECDVIHDGVVYDVKSSWDIHTFTDAKLETNKDYIWQIHGYMELFDCHTAKLCYVLNSAPDEVLFRELERESYKHPERETPEWIEVEIIKNLVYTESEFMRFINLRGIGGDEITDKAIESFVEIPLPERIYINEFRYDIENTMDIQNRVTGAREFLKEYYEALTA